MRDIILFTGNPINMEECKKVLCEQIKGCEENGANGFLIRKPSLTLIDIENERLSETLDCDFSSDEREVLKSHFSTEDVFINRIQFLRSIDAKRVISALMDECQNLLLYVDEISEEGGYCEATNYINKDLNY